MHGCDFAFRAEVLTLVRTLKTWEVLSGTGQARLKQELDSVRTRKTAKTKCGPTPMHKRLCRRPTDLRYLLLFAVAKRLDTAGLRALLKVQCPCSPIILIKSEVLLRPVPEVLEAPILVPGALPLQAQVKCRKICSRMNFDGPVLLNSPIPWPCHPYTWMHISGSGHHRQARRRQPLGTPVSEYERTLALHMVADVQALRIEAPVNRHSSGPPEPFLSTA